MKRRDFFKDAGIFACGCAIGGLCINSASNNKKETIARENIDDCINILPHIEIPITYHCNLNCAYCDHFSTIAPKYFMPLDVFEKDIEQMFKITHGNIKEIMLLGGEPLLNKDIEEYIKITRKYFKNSKLIVYTNGLLLNDMPENFWRTCNKYNVSIFHSCYPLYKGYPNLEDSYKKAIKYKIKLKSNYPRYKFSLMRLNKNTQNDKNKTYENCSEKITCAILDNGTLYPCPVIAGVKMFFNNAFKKYALPVDKSDCLDIHKIESADKIFEFYKKPKEFCKYCNRFTCKEFALWRLSDKKDAAEWYDI